MATSPPAGIEELLAASSATPGFKDALRRLAAGAKPDGTHISANPGAPPVKVLRVAMWLIESDPACAVRALRVEGQSGCSDYVGIATVNEERRFRFDWNCRWKAEQLGWRDFFGEPDQGRAARELGYRCMKSFDEVAVA